MIETERLILRPWRDADRDDFFAMSRSMAVMAHLGGVLDRSQCDAAVTRMQAYQIERGHCFWVVERRTDAAFIGLCGLKPGVIATIDGEIEIGWRLREDAWGRGYAREAALASLEWGWANLAVRRIVAITVPANTASWGLMARIGMIRRPDLDFGHPSFAPDHPLHTHIAYVAERPR